jgi:hypothetical protein
MNPLVRTLGLKQLEMRTQARVPTTTDLTSSVTEPALAGHVRSAWGRNKLAKERVDLKLLQCLRARRGVYSPSELSARYDSGGVNVIWYDLTETKCRAASAWVREILMPSNERPWALDPTPLPDLPLPFKKTIVAKSLEQAQQVMLQIAEAGGGTIASEEFRNTVKEIGDKLRTEAEQKFKAAAKKRALRMEQQIADRLAQGSWDSAMDAFVEDFVTYPAAVLKGPVYQRHKRLEWADGWTPKVSHEAAQTWEQVSPFDVYPAPGARTPQDGDFIERMRFWRAELHALKGLPGYQDEQIDRALMDYSAGHLEGWLWTEAERQRLTNETMYMWLSPPGVIDALNYYGSVPGWKLISWGVGESLEPTKDYEVNVLLVGRYVVYAALNPHPLGQRPYRRACYDEIPGAFWGRSIPELCETSQKFCNVAGCAMADNISMASGPMAWVHNDRLADGEQTLEIIPWKVWQLKDAGMGAGTNPGIGFFQAADNTASLMKVLEFWELKADDATGIPRYTYGNEQVGGAAGTATGLSMLLNNAAKGLRRAIGNVDLNVISPTIGDAFTNEMLYNPDESIKGDCIIVARGANAILIKDMAQQRRMQFLGMTANPIDMAIIGNRGRASLLRETALAMELPDDLVPDEDVLDERERAQQQAVQQQAQAQQQAELDAQQQQFEMDSMREERKEEFKQQASQRDQFNGLITDLIRSQLQANEPKKDASPTPEPPPAETKRAPRRISFVKNEAGEIVGADME